MDDVLERARLGTLSVAWREELQLPGGVAHTEGGIFGDAEVLVMNQIRERPYAAWEPGHARGWRDALMAWYVDSRTLVTQRYVDVTRQHVDRLQLEMGLLFSGQRVSTLPGGEGFWARLGEQTRIKDQMSDRSCRMQADLFTQARDRLTASYMAGLAAGGDDVDWLSWFEEQVSHWSAEMPGTSRAKLELGNGRKSFHAWMQRLPEYWRGVG